MAEFLLPSLGADMAEGTLVAWKIGPGDVVARGQVVAEIETDKGVIDVECFDPGVVDRLVAQPGQKLPVGAVLAVIRSEGEAHPTASAPPPLQAAHQLDSSPTTSGPPPAATQAHRAESATRLKITPAARRRAAELGLDLSKLMPSQPENVVELADVERLAAHAAPPQSVKAPDDGRERMRRAIAAAMSRSKREIPHYYLKTSIDMTRALAWLEEANRSRSLTERMLPAVLQIKAVAAALVDVPELNGFWIDGRHQPAERVHIGLAIAMKGGGLVAPALHDTDKKSLDEIMAALHDLIPRARVGRLRSSEMTDATITLTNLGDLGVETVFGVIYPPQVALVGFGKIARRPWAENDAVVVRQILDTTLAADHRASDGRRGAQFLEALNHRLQTPESL